MGRGNGYDHDVSAVRGYEDGVEVGADATWRLRVLSDAAKLRPSIEDRDALVRELERTLRETYLRNCDPAAPY